MIKVNYNPETTLVLGYYPDSVRYNNIPEPFIEIMKEEFDSRTKVMCVVNGVYQEYVRPSEELLQEAKDKKIIELKANRKAADLQDHNHEINGSWYSFHMDSESRNLLSSILSSATSIKGLDPKNTTHDTEVIYPSFGVREYNHITKTVGNKSLVNLTYRDLRDLYSHMAVRMGLVYSLYIMAKDEIEAETDIEAVEAYDVNINYTTS